MKFTSATIISALAVHQMVYAQETCNFDEVANCMAVIEPTIYSCMTSTSNVETVDYNCLCDKYKEMVACYDQCLDSTEKALQEQDTKEACAMISGGTLGETPTNSVISGSPIASDLPSTTTAATTPTSSTSEKTESGAGQLKVVGSSIVLSALCFVSYYIL
ncbi:hypothetical protein BDB01DRAFT_854310 [Pilobolus umbonatus]|nr:hypothetical protein BDB01DRAFT_854310 [Pilobolus umbonatus]